MKTLMGGTKKKGGKGLRREVADCGPNGHKGRRWAPIIWNMRKKKKRDTVCRRIDKIPVPGELKEKQMASWKRQREKRSGSQDQGKKG